MCLCVRASSRAAYLSPRVFVSGAREHGGRAAQRYNLKIFPPKLGGHGELLPALPARLPLAELRYHRRMMGHLATTQILNLIYQTGQNKTHGA